jgi:hypothetical protein
VRTDDGATVVDVAAGGVTITTGGSVQLTAPVVDINATAGTPLALVNDTFYQWYAANIQPFLVSKGYGGPPIPVGSETTVLKGQ